MIRDIINLFNERKSLDIDEIANHFNITESALEGMLKILINKNLVELVTFDCVSCSNSCGSCSFAKHKDVYKLKK